jgi:hypothetical protein
LVETLAAYNGAVTYGDFVAMNRKVRMRLYQQIPHIVAERKIHMIQAISMAVNGGPEAETALHRWQVMLGWVKVNTAESIRNLRRWLHQNLDPRHGVVDDATIEDYAREGLV